MNNERSERREQMLQKVRKLLAMGKGNANANESETAMRQANKIMAEFGIAEAECDMTAIDKGEMIFGEAQATPDGRAPAEGKVFRTVPAWTGVLCVGIAKFTDSVVIRKTTQHGQIFAFRGEKDDVLLARWLFAVLIDSIHLEHIRSGWTKTGEANSFRMAAACTLQKRLYALAAERRAMYQEAKVTSNSRALVVVDRKALAIAEKFGEQKTKRVGQRSASNGAAIAGRDAGQRINIPSGRPIGQSSSAGALR